jgi:hypothetical protein
MLSGISAILLPSTLLAVAVGFAYALTTCHTVDPKFTLLESMLRSVDHQSTASRHKHAA